MNSSREEAGEQVLPDEIICLIMNASQPDDACRMSLASKSFRQYYILNFSPSKEEIAALKKAMKNRDAANAALISKTWQWKVAVRLQPGETSLRQGHKKLEGPLASCAPVTCAIKYHLVVQEILWVADLLHPLPHSH